MRNVQCTNLPLHCIAYRAKTVAQNCFNSLQHDWSMQQRMRNIVKLSVLSSVTLVLFGHFLSIVMVVITSHNWSLARNVIDSNGHLIIRFSLWSCDAIVLPNSKWYNIWSISTFCEISFTIMISILSSDVFSNIFLQQLLIALLRCIMKTNGCKTELIRDCTIGTWKSRN